jgi:hypothetical protein
MEYLQQLFSSIIKYYDNKKKKEYISNPFGGSTTTTNSMTDLEQKCTSIMVSSMQNCGSVLKGDQTLTISGNNNILDGGKQKQYIHYQANCDQLAQNMVSIQTQIATEIEQKAIAIGQQISMTDVSSTNINNILHNVQEHVNINTMNEIMTTVNMTQGIDVSGNNNIIRNWTQDQTGDLLVSASQKVLNQIDSFTEVNNKIKQTADAKTENMLSFLTDWLQNVPLIIGIVAVIFLYIMFGGGSSPTDQVSQVSQMAQQWIPPPTSATYNNMFQPHNQMMNHNQMMGPPMNHPMGPQMQPKNHNISMY